MDITKLRLKLDSKVDLTSRHPKPVIRFIKAEFDCLSPGGWIVQDYSDIPMPRIELDEVIIVQDNGITHVVVSEDKPRSMTGDAFNYISNEYSIVKTFVTFAACKRIGIDAVRVKVGNYDNQSVCALKVFTAWICGITSVTFYYDDYKVPHSVLHTLSVVSTPAKYFVSFNGLNMNQLSPSEVYPKISSFVSRLKFLEAAIRDNVEDGKKILSSSTFDLQSTLLEMVAEGNTRFVRLLLNDSRVDPAAKEKGGNSLLELALIRGYNEIVEMLLLDPRTGELTDVVVEI